MRKATAFVFVSALLVVPSVRAGRLGPNREKAGHVPQSSVERRFAAGKR